MKKILSMLAVAAAFAVVACTPEDKPKDDGGDAKAPVAEFEYSVDGLSVSFTNKSTDAVGYKWDFGDGETSKEANPTHEYASSGEYTVKLTAANADGVTSKKEATIKLAGAVKAYFSVVALEGREGLFGKALKFDATSSENATSIVWDFGDGESSTDFEVTHAFPEFKTYTVKATVSNEAGQSDTYESEVTPVAKNELLQGCGMGADDAQHWKFVTSNNPEWFGEDQFPNEPSWAAEFGYTADAPSLGDGTCFRANAEKQLAQAAFTFALYQAVELEAGDSLCVNVALKWGENTNNDGLFWVGICSDEDAVINNQVEAPTVTEGHWAEMFNYWAAAGTADWGDGGASVPAYDGDLLGTEAWTSANETLGLGYSGPESTGFKVTNSGTYYFFINYRNVWGNYWGGDVLIDNASLKIIL